MSGGKGMRLGASQGWAGAMESTLFDKPIPDLL